MAELNFPKDRTELNPPGTGPLQTGDKYTANGITWTYDGDARGWNSGGGTGASELYLSKISDDTAAGAITFENGVSVTGGELNSTEVFHSAGAAYYAPGTEVFNYQTNTGSTTLQSRITLDSTKTALTSASTKTYHNFLSQNILNESSTIGTYNGFTCALLNPAGSIDFTGSITGFVASDSLSAKSLGTSYGFSSQLSGSGNFNFHAPGDAPNYFAGETFFISNDRAGIEAGSATGAYVNSNGVRVSSRNQTSAANHLAFRNPNGSIGAIGTKDSDFRVENLGTGYVKFIVNGTEGLEVREDSILSLPVFNKTNSNSTNLLRVTSAGLFQRSTSSRRYKNNIRDCAMFDGTASDSVKQLQPRTWEDYESGETVCGFIAEELYELGGEHMVSFSPWSIQTDEGVEYRTGNGETPVTKDAVPMSDDVEIVDGINDRALTILLTKALQEALGKIETLEQRLTDAGIA